MGSESNTLQESRGTSSHTTQCHDKYKCINWTLFFTSPIRRTEIVDNVYIVEVGLGWVTIP